MTGPHIEKTRPPVEHIVHVELTAKPPETQDLSASDKEQLQRPRGFQVLVAPAEVPMTLPEITLSAATREEDFSGRGIEGGIADGLGALPRVTKRVPGGEPYDAELVDRPPVMIDPGFTPRYPDELKRDALDGLVVVRFVLDTTGRIEPATVHVVKSTNPAFTESVRSMLDTLRYSPGWMNGRKVRTRVDQPFEFHFAR